MTIDPTNKYLPPMKTSRCPSSTLFLFLVLAVPALFAKQDSLVIAVNSSVSGSYPRRVLPDGNIKPLTYVVGNGGLASQDAQAGAVNNVTFPTIIRLLAPRLAQQNLYPSRKAMAADLMLVIYWGETTPFNDAYLQNANANLSSSINTRTVTENVVKASVARGERQFTIDGIQSADRSVRDAARDDAESQLFQSQLFEQMRLSSDEANARLLGYVGEINRRNNASRFGGAGDYFTELMNDLETPRYYVIVQAFDFQAATVDKQRKLLWTTRISIPASGSDFNNCLPAMLSDATGYFGRNSNGLIRRYRTGVVRLGELEVLGVEAGERPSEPKPETAN